MMDLFRGLCFLRHMGFSVILASLEDFDFGLLGEVMIGMVDQGYVMRRGIYSGVIMY